MSSLIRRVETSIMKRAGYTREKWILVKGKNGDPVPQSVKRNGEITDPDDNPIGRDWPVRIPRRIAAPAKRITKNQTHHALRRSKRSQAWLERRAAERTA